MTFYFCVRQVETYARSLSELKKGCADELHSVMPIMSYARDRRMRFHRILANHRGIRKFLQLISSAPPNCVFRIPFDELLAVTNVAAELSADAGGRRGNSSACSPCWRASAAPPSAKRAVYVGGHRAIPDNERPISDSASSADERVFQPRTTANRASPTKRTRSIATTGAIA